MGNWEWEIESFDMFRRELGICQAPLQRQALPAFVEALFPTRHSQFPINYHNSSVGVMISDDSYSDSFSLVGW